MQRLFEKIQQDTVSLRNMQKSSKPLKNLRKEAKGQAKGRVLQKQETFEPHDSDHDLAEADPNPRMTSRTRSQQSSEDIRPFRVYQQCRVREYGLEEVASNDKGSGNKFKTMDYQNLVNESVGGVANKHIQDQRQRLSNILTKKKNQPGMQSDSWLP